MPRQEIISLVEADFSSSELVFGDVFTLPPHVVEVMIQVQIHVGNTSPTYKLQLHGLPRGGYGYAPLFVTRHSVKAPGNLAEHTFSYALGGNVADQIENMTTSAIKRCSGLKLGVIASASAAVGDTCKALLIY